MVDECGPNFTKPQTQKSRKHDGFHHNGHLIDTCRISHPDRAACGCARLDAKQLHRLSSAASAVPAPKMARPVDPFHDIMDEEEVCDVSFVILRDWARR